MDYDDDPPSSGSEPDDKNADSDFDVGAVDRSGDSDLDDSSDAPDESSSDEPESDGGVSSSSSEDAPAPEARGWRQR
jgi:hypothetical protein